MVKRRTTALKQKYGNILGRGTPVMDAGKKVTGQLRYVDDIKLPGMLFGKILFSPYPHARILEIDTSEAEKMPGVYAAVCYRDAPDVRYNGNGEDSEILPSEKIFDQEVRYAGDRVAAVAAESEQIAAEALKKIRVSYEPLPYYLDPEEAAKDGAYPIHEHGNILMEVDNVVGDMEEGFRQADFVFENKYQVPAIHHGAIEPHVSISFWDMDGKLTVFTPTQDVFGQRKNLAKIFTLPMNKVRVVSPAMGGGFGSKIDLVTEPVGALLAKKCGRPVKVRYSRREDIRSGLTRHAETIYVKTGVKKDGTITACDYKVYLNAGAHSGATMSVTWAAGGKFLKLFKIPNMHYHAIPVYTNTTVAGAMRGFGSPQLFFALNAQFNEIASRLSMDLCTLELKNMFRPKDLDGKGENLGNFKIQECLKKGKELFGWEKEWKLQEESKQKEGRFRIGVGMAAAPHGSSLYGVMPDTCGVSIKMNEDGSLTMFTGVSDMGNGSNTTQRMYVSEVLGIPEEYIAVVRTDTETTLYDVGAYASRGTYVGGGAALKAARMVKRKVLREASELLELPSSQIVLRENRAVCCFDETRFVTMKQVAEHAHEKERDIAISAIYGTKAAPISGGVHFAKVQVDMDTGEVRVLKYAAVHDVGKPINPLGLEGQVHGGIQMGLGYALSEGLSFLPNGKIKETRFRDCHLFTADQMPEITVAFLDSYEQTGPCGAKSVGECATVPAAAAAANAVSNAAGHYFCSLPIRKEQIMEVCAKSGQQMRRSDM